ESRGGHFRSDYPQTDAQGKRTFTTLSEVRKTVAEAVHTASRAKLQAVK
ncbi:MAG: hypothetical protein JNL06_00270, partial [Alphaproteobacteria bacterium]|nr:hypothetical protein [Alphaproteobacteria bacterium]